MGVQDSGGKATADAINLDSLDSDSSSNNSVSPGFDSDWKKAILQQIQHRDEKEKTPFADITKANPVLPMDDLNDDQGEWNRRFLEAQKRLLAHKRLARLLLLLCVCLLLSILVMAIVLGVKSANNEANAAARCSKTTAVITSQFQLDEINDNACDNLFGLEIRGLSGDISVNSAQTLNFLLVSSCGNPNAPVRLLLPKLVSITRLDISNSTLTELQAPDLASCQFLELYAGTNLSFAYIPAAVLGNIIIQDSTVGQLSLGNVTRLYSLVVLESGLREIRMDRLESLTSVRIENTAGERFSLDADAERDEMGDGEGPMAVATGENNRRTNSSSGARSRTMRASGYERANKRWARRGSGDKPQPMSLSLGNLRTLLVLSMTSVYIDKLVFAQDVRMREVRLRYVTFTSNTPANFDLSKVQLIDILRLYNCSGIGEINLSSVSRMSSLSIENCPGLKAVALGPGLQICNDPAPSGTKLLNVDIINLCHLGESRKGLFIDDLLFSQNSDLGSIDLGGLSVVDHVLEVSFNPRLLSVVAPALGKVGSLLAVHNSALERLSVEELVQGDLVVSYNPQLGGAFVLPRYTTAGIVLIYKNQFVSLEFPNLSKMTFATAIARSAMWAVAVAIMTSDSGSIVDIENEASLVNVSIPLMTNVHDIIIANNFQMKNLELGSLSNVTGSFFVSGNNKLSGLFLPLVSADNITVKGNTLLQDIRLPRLRDASIIDIDFNIILQSIDLSQLEFVPNVNYSITIADNPLLCLGETDLDGVTAGVCQLNNRVECDAVVINRTSCVRNEMSGSIPGASEGWAAIQFSRGVVFSGVVVFEEDVVFTSSSNVTFQGPVTFAQEPVLANSTATPSTRNVVFAPNNAGN